MRNAKPRQCNCKLAPEEGKNVDAGRVLTLIPRKENRPSVPAGPAASGRYTADVCAMMAHFKRIPPCRIKGPNGTLHFTMTIMLLITIHPSAMPAMSI